MAIKLSAHNYYNEKYAPSGAKKAYVARLTGRDIINSKFTFTREFLGNGNVLVDDAGLYEVRNVDKNGRPDDDYYAILEVDGELRKSDCLDREEAMKLAKMLGERSIDACCEIDEDGTFEFITAKQAVKAAEAKTLDQITNDCWLMIQNLTEKQAKAVLSSLKARVSPKIPATAAPVMSDTPVGIVNDYATDNGASAIGTGMVPTPVMPEPQMAATDIAEPAQIG